MPDSFQTKFLKFKWLRSFVDILKLTVLVNWYTRTRTVFDTPYLLTSYSAKESWKFTVSFSKGSCYFHLSFHFFSKNNTNLQRILGERRNLPPIMFLFTSTWKAIYALFLFYIEGLICLFNSTVFAVFTVLYTFVLSDCSSVVTQ